MTQPATPRVGHSPIKMRLVSDEDAVENVGDFAWWTNDAGVRHIKMAVPRGDDTHWLFCVIPVKQGQNETGKHWGWDGNEDVPTLTPSVHHIGHWHGWVRAGALVEA